MKKMHILLLGALPILLLFVTCAQDTPTSVSPSDDELTEITLAKNANIDVFDMNDRFSGSGASGSGFVKVSNGKMDLRIHASGLTANHAYEVHVAVGVKDAACSTFAPDHVEVFSVTIDNNGKFNFKRRGFDLGLASGQYRLDLLVVHAPFDHGGFVLACAPAPCVTI